MPYPPFPSIYNPFLVSEPQIAVPPQLNAQQTDYPQMTGDIQAQLSDANRMTNAKKFGNVMVGGIDITQQPDPLYSSSNIGPLIKTFEYNQPNIIQQKTENEPKLFSKVETVPDPPPAGMLEALVNVGNEPIDAGIFSPSKKEVELKVDPTTKTESTVTTNTNPVEIEKPFWSWQTQMGKYGQEKLPPPDPNKTKPYDITKNWMSDSFNSDPTNTTDPTNPNNPPKNNFGLADGYYLGNSLLNASVAINNMVQPEPPSIQMKLPHFERQRLNPEPYDNMRSQIRDQGTQAYRLQRENISQASDLMKGLAAVTSGTQQGLMNIGMQQAGAEQQVQNANQQISMQEQGMQTDTLNNEAITNWKIQDEFYKTKGQAISTALAALSQTGGQFAKYKAMQEMVNKQDSINKSAAEINNEMQANLLQYELSESALSSQEYQDYYKSQRTAEQDRINKELLGDEKYKAFNDYNNGVIPSYSSYQYNIDSPESQEKLRTINIAKRFQSEYPLGAAPDINKFPNDPNGYKAAVAEYDKYKTYNDRYNNDPRYKAYEAEQAFWKEALERFNESTLKKSTAETYLKSRNLPTQTEILQRLKAISERGAQSFG